VRSYLEALAKEFRELRERITELEGELEAERGKVVVVDAPRVDVAAITSALGEETARVLRTAQEAADDLRTRAEDGAARALKEAHEEAARIRGAAETVLAERTAEAEAAAATIRTDAESAAAKLREEATAASEGTIADAIAQGKDMLGQAQAARERVLSDLARRRKVALAQLDSLRAGRERLDGSLRAARVELDRIADELTRSDTEARLAEEAVGHVPLPAGIEPAAAPAGTEAPAAPAATESPTTGPAATEPAATEPAAAPAGTEAPGATAATGPATTATAEAPAPPAAAEPPAAEPVGPAEAAPSRNETDAASGKDVKVGAAVAGAAAPATTVTGSGRKGGRKKGATRGEDAGAAGSRSPYRHDRVPAAVLPAAAVGTAPEEEHGKVDELFAKIRADRAQKVTEARAVLDEPEAGGAPDASALEAPRSDADESWLQRRDALLEEPLAAVLRSVKRGLADDQNLALERLRTARPAAMTVDAVLGSAEDHLGRAVAWSVQGLARCARAGAELAGGEGPVGDDVVAAAAAELAHALIDPVRKRLAQLIDANGADHAQETSDGMTSAYREARATVDRLVGDAATTMVSAGERLVLAEGTPVRWVVEDADGPCPDCDDNALAGATPLGQAFPTGQGAPPAHPGCRCVLAPTPA